MAVTAAGAAAGGAAAAVFGPGTTSFMPMLSLAAGSRLLALASSGSDTWLWRAMLSRVSPWLTTWTLGADATAATGLLTGAAKAGAGAAAVAVGRGMISCWPGC